VKTFKQLIAEQSDYEKAWLNHRSEINALDKNNFDRTSTTDVPKGSRFGYTARHTNRNGDEHKFLIGFTHDNYTRVNGNVKTKHTKLRQGHYAGPTFDPGSPHTVEEKDHASIADAIEYVKKQKEHVAATEGHISDKRN
jgi:hypothetical protein